MIRRAIQSRGGCCYTSTAVVAARESTGLRTYYYDNVSRGYTNVNTRTLDNRFMFFLSRKSDNDPSNPICRLDSAGRNPVKNNNKIQRNAEIPYSQVPTQ